MHPLSWSYRTVHLAGFLACAALIGFVVFAQYGMGLDPCPLCILQRVVFMVMGLVFLVVGLHAPRGRGRWLYSGLLAALALAGVGIAARHLWIQSLPPGAVPSCGAPLGFLLQTRGAHGGLLGVLRMVLSGSGECAKVQKILFLPIPLWSLIWFVLLGAASVFASRPRRTT